MSFRQAMLLGGAALILAACADSTAPGSQMHRAGVNAAAADSTKGKPTPGTRTMESTSVEECRSGVFVYSGRSDSTCVESY